MNTPLLQFERFIVWHCGRWDRIFISVHQGGIHSSVPRAFPDGMGYNIHDTSGDGLSQYHGIIGQKRETGVLHACIYIHHPRNNPTLNNTLHEHKKSEAKLGERSSATYVLMQLFGLNGALLFLFGAGGVGETIDSCVRSFGGRIPNIIHWNGVGAAA